jgi:hypothetical protein
MNQPDLAILAPGQRMAAGKLRRHTLICRSLATICFGVNVFFGITRFLSVFQSLSDWHRNPDQVSTEPTPVDWFGVKNYAQSCDSE